VNRVLYSIVAACAEEFEASAFTALRMMASWALDSCPIHRFIKKIKKKKNLSLINGQGYPEVNGPHCTTR
jgi:hypothetical protein